MQCDQKPAIRPYRVDLCRNLGNRFRRFPQARFGSAMPGWEWEAVKWSVCCEDSICLPVKNATLSLNVKTDQVRAAVPNLHEFFFHPSCLQRRVVDNCSHSSRALRAEHFNMLVFALNRISLRRCLEATHPICVLISRIITAADTQPPHLVLKGCSLKSKALSRPPFPGYPSGRVAQSIDNHAPLSFAER
jgi:hypothetical protein